MADLRRVRHQRRPRSLHAPRARRQARQHCGRHIQQQVGMGRGRVCVLLALRDHDAHVRGAAALGLGVHP